VEGSNSSPSLIAMKTWGRGSNHPMEMLSNMQLIKSILQHYVQLSRVTPYNNT
jgi:hypothetical protein